jgi:hypothetical protein
MKRKGKWHGCSCEVINPWWVLTFEVTFANTRKHSGQDKEGLSLVIVYKEVACILLLHLYY